MNTSEARSWQQAIPERNREINRHPEPKKQVKVHVHKRWITPGEKFLYVMFALITATALIYVVSFSSQVDTLNRNIQSLESNISQQETTNANLSYQVQEYSNPDRILRIAKENGLKIQNTKVIQTTSFVE